jgi:signal transduction histidine kinase
MSSSDSQVSLGNDFVPVEAIALLPSSPLSDWRWQLRNRELRIVTVPEGALAHDIVAQCLPEDPEDGPSAQEIVLEGLDLWSSESAATRFLVDLRALFLVSGPSPSIMFIVPLGWRLLLPHIVPLLHVEEFGVFPIEPHPRDSAWDSLATECGLSMEGQFLDELYLETGGQEVLAKDVLKRIKKRSADITFKVLAEALAEAKGDAEGVLGSIRNDLLGSPEIAEAIHLLVEGGRDLSRLDEARLLATGLVRARLQRSSHVFTCRLTKEFAEENFSSERLAEFYRESGNKVREFKILEILAGSNRFVTSKRDSERAAVHLRLAELAAALVAENEVEPLLFKHSAAYTHLVGHAQRFQFLEEFFIEHAAKSITSLGYTGYRIALERFVKALSIITNQLNIRLHTLDPLDTSKIVCHIWRRGPELYRNKPEFTLQPLDGQDSLVARVIRGDLPDVDTRDVFRESGTHTEFAREHGIRSLVVRPLQSESRCFGAVVLENPYEGLHPIRPGALPIVQKFLEKVSIAIQTASIVASEVELQSRMKVFIDVLQTSDTKELVTQALRLARSVLPQIEVAAVRLFEGMQHKRRRLLAYFPPDNPELETLAKASLVVEDKTDEKQGDSESKVVEFPSASGIRLEWPNLSNLPAGAPGRLIMEKFNLKWIMTMPLTLERLEPVNGDALDENGDPIGRVTLYGTTNPFPSGIEAEEANKVIGAIGGYLRLALRNILQREEAERRDNLLGEIFDGLRQLAQSDTSQKALREIFLEKVLEACCREFDADVAHCLRVAPDEERFGEVVFIKGQQQRSLSLLASGGRLTEEISNKRQTILEGEGISGRAASRARAEPDYWYEVFPDVRAPELHGVYIDYVRSVRSALVIVLRRINGELLGVFTLESSKPDRFNGRAIRLARQVSYHLANAIDFSDLIESMATGRTIKELGVVTMDVAHWLGNVVSLIRNKVERAKEALSRPERLGDLGPIAESLGQALHLLDIALDMRQNLRLPSRDQADWENIDVSGLIAEVLVMLEGLPISIKKPKEPIQLKGNREFLLRSIHALLRNAQDAVRDISSPKIMLSVRKITLRGRVLLEIQVGDNGPGIERSKVPEYLRAFKSTKPPSKGTGLGLFLVRNTVEAHNGELEIDTDKGAGLRAYMRLPLNQSLPQNEDLPWKERHVPNPSG